MNNIPSVNQLKRRFLAFAVGCVLTVHSLLAQTPASVTWPLTSDTTSVSIGNVIGLGEFISADTNGFALRNYNANGQRMNQGSNGWTKETTQNEKRYVEFDAACSDTAAGSYFTVSSVSLNYGGAGSTNAMNCNIWYSTDNWNTRTKIGSGLVFPNSTMTSFSSPISATVTKGGVFSLRVYPYWVIATTTSTSKYVVLNTVVLSGSTGVVSVPTVSTDSITNITLSTAICGGIVIAANGSLVTARGVCWNTTGLPTISDAHTLDGSEVGMFTSSLTGLSEKTYYVRAYATNSVGTGYGAQISFTINAAALSPVVTTADVTGITTAAAISGGVVTSDGGSTVTARGVCWNKKGLPSISDSLTLDGSGTGSFVSTLRNLSARTMYYVRAYAKNGLGTSYGKQIAFTTAQPTISVIHAAYGDGIHFDTKAIQTAIDSLAGLGGGIVQLAYGKFLSAPLKLKSNITFLVDSTATLLASQNVHDYYPAGADTNQPATSLVDFISSSFADNITITGYGTIDGQGAPWWAAENVAKAHGGDTLRPRLIELENGSHIVVTHITLKNAPMFHLCPNSCYDVRIDSITITAPSTAPNTDGIDPGKCHHVRITNCTISNGDDNIAVGCSSADANWPNAASSDIIISHCTFGTGHGVSIGSYTAGGIDSMLVDSCTFSGTTNGLRVKTARDRGGNVRNVTYSNITMTNVRYPIFLTEYYPSIPAQTDPIQGITATTPTFHDISIVNLTSTNTASNSQAGIIVGLPESKLSNIHLRNVSISAKIAMQVRNATVDTLNTLITGMFGSPYTLEVNGVLSRGVTSAGNTALHPVEFSLDQNYPNPFNPTTMIHYTIPNTGNPVHVVLKVYTMLGREVATLVHGNQHAGSYDVQFDASALSSGLYFYRLTAGGFSAAKKMILIK